MRSVVRLFVIALACAIGVWTLYSLKRALLLLVFAIFFAYLIEPLVELVRRPLRIRGHERVLPRPLSIIVVYLVIFGSIALASYLLLPRIGEQITEFTRQAPAYLITVRGRVQSLNSVYQRYPLPPNAREAIDGGMG